jgi:lauroyl/myristoyl acyltransferase
MDYLLGCSPRAGEVETLAKRYLFETYKRAELRWRPWVTTRQRVDNIERLQAAVADERGVLLSFMHHGQYDGLFASVGGLSLGLRAAGHAELMAGLHFDYRKRHADTVSLGANLFDVSAGFGAMCDMLKAGDLLALASDLPSSGSLTVDLLGRPVRAATGAARLSYDADALVVVVTAHKDGGLQRLQVHEPFAARDCGSFEQVQAAIFARHSPAVLAWPEALEQPLRRTAPGPQDEAEFGLDAASFEALPV